MVRTTPLTHFDVYFEPGCTGVSASLGIEATSAEWRDQVQVLTLALFAARLIANLRTKGYGWRIAEYLIDPRTEIDTLGPVRWVDHPAGGATRGFSTSVGFGREVHDLREIIEHNVPVFFELKPIGFGLLGRDVGEYSLRAVDAAFGGASVGRKDDAVFRTALRETASALGASAKGGEVTARRQTIVAVAAAAVGWTLATGEGFDSRAGSPVQQGSGPVCCT